MTAYANAFKAEVERAVRKAMKAEISALRKTLAARREEIGVLKRTVKELETRTSKIEKARTRQLAAHEPDGAGSAEPSQPKGRRFVFRPAALTAKREWLGLTHKDMAALLGAAVSSERKWEEGTSAPRAAQIDKIRAVLAMGKREARRALGS
jgi:DNA-binding transcriptional regulator YiaG